MARCARCTTRWTPSAAASARPSRQQARQNRARCRSSRGRFLKQHPAVPLCGEGAKAARTPAMPLIVKICGLKTPETLDVVLESGADLVGFVFFAPSPRHLGLPAARALGERVKGRAHLVRPAGHDVRRPQPGRGRQNPFRQIVRSDDRLAVGAGLARTVYSLHLYPLQLRQHDRASHRALSRLPGRGAGRRRSSHAGRASAGLFLQHQRRHDPLRHRLGTGIFRRRLRSPDRLVAHRFPGLAHQSGHLAGHWSMLVEADRALVSIQAGAPSSVRIFMRSYRIARYTLAAALFLSAAHAQPSKGTPAAKAKLDEARAALKDKDEAKAEAAFRAAIELDPNFLDAQEAFVRAVNAAEREKVKDVPEAQKQAANQKASDVADRKLDAFYQEWVKRYPTKAAFLYMLGDIYMYTDYDKVERYTLQAIQVDPKFTSAYQNMALIEEVRGNTAKRMDYLKRATGADPTDESAAFYYANAQRDFNPALYRKLSEEVATRFPTSERGAQALYWLAFDSPTLADKIKYLEQCKSAF